MSDSNISYMPTDGLSYDAAEDKYWDPNALAKEIERAYEVCHGCRMCFKYCDSFPTLFNLIDNQYDGDVRKVTDADNEVIMDHCFQCKLCEVQCPYTPREGHEFQLDFPKLVHRYNAQRTREKGASFRNKVLANPDGAAKAARSSFGLANKMNRVKMHRWLMEKVLGVHRDKLLPDFAGTTFEKWAAQEGRLDEQPKGEAPEVVLFQTCYVQNNEPQIGRDALDVMDKNSVSATCVKGLKCCGMPAWEHGDIETLRKNAEHNIETLLPFVEQGSAVVGLNPTCTMMMRREYEELLPPELREKAKKLAEAIRDPGEFLWAIRKEERFNTDFKSTPGNEVAYHAPCHLRAQGVGFKGRDLLKKIPGVKPKPTMECCGHDGTYAMKVEGFEPSQRIGKKAFDGMKAAENAEVWVTDCPLAALQFAQHAGRKPMHPMSVLAKAYREDGFQQKIESQTSE